MKKNVYGNIEDMLVRVKMVTAIGTFSLANVEWVAVKILCKGPS